MTRHLLVLLALLSTAPVFAQDIGQELKGIVSGHLHPDPVAPQPPTLLVEVVDPVQSTLPGVTVTVTTRANPKQRFTATTDEDGIARFSVPQNAEYEIEAVLVGFKKGGEKSVWVGGMHRTDSKGQIRSSPRPRATITHSPSHVRVQIRLKLSGPSIVVE